MHYWLNRLKIGQSLEGALDVVNDFFRMSGLRTNAF